MAIDTTIDRLGEHVGQTVTLRGWLYNSRSSGKLLFLIVRDGTGMCQCVFEKTDATAERFSVAKHLGQESSLVVTGEVRADERSVGGYELTVSDVEVVQAAEGFPITPKAHGADFLLRNRHLWFRSKRQWAILRIRATVIDAIRRFFNDREYVLIDTPIFAPSAGEGAQTLFEVDYFGDKVYLAQTGQLYVEAACMSHRKVYCFGPTFRAERSKTRRHLTEFWMVEPEIAYCDLDEVIGVAEDLVCAIVQRVLAERRTELEILECDPSRLEAVRKPFYRITYSEAADLLRGPQAREMLERDLEQAKARVAELKREIEEKEKQRRAGGVKKWKAEKLAQEIAAAREELADREEDVRNIPHHMELAANFEWGGDLGGSDETIIARLHDRPVFVTHYPAQCKAFYMKQNADDPRLVDNFDLLAPDGYGEIIGGSQREDDLEILLRKMDEHKLDRGPYEWYLDLRRYGSVPHGGFGLGVERTVRWICRLKHIRETIPYPRMMGRIEP
ncbi:MAG: asparagine--tRNA ligase [Planctomycetota bacterium]|nr:MAG: asparagine--tRNA ligase [Planctomycetota bacterium]